MRRCAIYTRKSTDEGLDQDFNSLHAQREACEAYIKSQQHEGWKLVRDPFDDGGYSGGSMDRPGLALLMDAIRLKRIDTVVVYKVDRLTRSLADFAKMVDLFDAHQVSFVSVTQQFNTTTSMGRLTLNVLLSFAQFEREVTAERIRDKIAASKKKGLWMGGPLPLGYDVKDRKLVINGPEADAVRTLFREYLRLGSVRCLLEDANDRGIVTKRRQVKGKTTGGKPFSRGNLYQLLSNPLYVARIAHKGATYPAQHTAIIDDETWAAVQTKLTGNAAPRIHGKNASSRSLLTGLLFDETGDALTPTSTHRHGRRYRYYISGRLAEGKRDRGEGWRIPAQTIEVFVKCSICKVLSDEDRLLQALTSGGVSNAKAREFVEPAAEVARRIEGATYEVCRLVFLNLVRRITIRTNGINVEIAPAALLEQSSEGLPPKSGSPETTIRIEFPCPSQRRGFETRIVIPAAEPSPQSQRAISLIARAYTWLQKLTNGSATSVRALAIQEGIDETDVSRFLPLAFLAPEFLKDVLSPSTKIALSAERLRNIRSFSSEWAAQS